MFPELVAKLPAQRASVPTEESEDGVAVTPEESGTSMGQLQCGGGSPVEEPSSSPRAAVAVAPTSIGPSPTPRALADRALAAVEEDAERDSLENDVLTEAVAETTDPLHAVGLGRNCPVGSPADPLVD
jgi:hypothetical protein